MSTPLNPQEVYLLERYSSLEYFGQMRDEFAACVKAAEDALAEFMRKLPANYRKRPLSEQPDVVWGERIIPNMRWALLGLNDGYIQLSHGEADGLGMAGNVTTTFTSIQRDYSSEWMPNQFQMAYDRHESSARQMARNIFHTQQGSWSMNTLANFNETNRGPFNPPSSWPQYRLNATVRVRSGDIVPIDGVYLPDVPLAAAQFLIKGYEAWEARVAVSAAHRSGDRTEQRPTTWTLVERIADGGGGIPGATDPTVAGIRLRCIAGKPCPRAGYWFTPARSDSRHRFREGEVMPAAAGDYGTTIWQWDDDQDS